MAASFLSFMVRPSVGAHYDLLRSVSILDEKFFHILTWGCQMNEEDSEKLSGMLKNLGYSRTKSREKAEIIIVVILVQC